MFLKELLLLSEGAVADKYEELKDTATEYAPYMFIEAKPAAPDDVGSSLPSIIIGPTLGRVRTVKTTDYIARVIQTGIIKFDNPIKQLYVLDAKTFNIFTELPKRKTDVEGFFQYESEGEGFDAVKDTTGYIMKKGINLTKMPVSLFDKQFRVKAK